MFAYITNWIHRLFFGGDCPIKMVSVRIRSTNKNFENFVNSLCYFDIMLSGGDLKNYGNIGNKDVLLIDDLINNVIGKPRIRKYDVYIYDTFKCFIVNKQKIILNLHALYEVKTDNKMIDLIMYGLEQHNMMSELNQPKRRDSNDGTNLFISEIFKVLKNIKNITIQSTDVNGIYCYPFSLLLLLNASTLVEKVIVKAVRYCGEDSWLGLLWNSSSLEIKQQYQRNYNITKKRIKSNIDYDEDWLEIVKKHK